MKVSNTISLLQWKENPLLQLVVFACCGKVIFDAWLPDSFILFLMGAFLAAGGFLLLWQSLALKIPKAIRLFRSALIWMGYIWIGAVFSFISHNPIQAIDNHAFTCTIEENYGESKPGRWRLVANIREIKNSAGWQKANGRLILNVDGECSRWHYGSRLLVASPLQLMDPPSVPGQFNAQQYFHRQGIDYQVWTTELAVNDLAGSDTDPIRLAAIQIRTWMENQIIAALPQKDDAYMMNALLLGIRRKIDPELKAAYSAAGVTHILAVSGMHVGLIFWALQFIFGWMRKSRQGIWTFTILITCLLWFYALVTGMSPSVLRAVAVFTIIQWSDVARKLLPPVNGLCLATLILFAINPDIIYDVGYQLSFSAVYGIISFHRPLEDLWRIKKMGFWSSPLTRAKWEFWNAVTVSVAATLGTFPIILLYFHQFPTYFLLANVVAVPISTALIFGAIGILILSPFPILAGWLGWLSSWVIAFLNAFVVWVSQLPFSLLEDVYLYLPQLALILIGLIFLQMWMQALKTRMLYTSLIFMLLACLSTLGVNIYRWRRPPVHFVLNAKAGWQFGIIEHRKITLIDLDPSRKKSTEDQTFEVKALKEGFHTIYWGSDIPQFKVFSFGKKDSSQRSGIGYFQGKTYVLLGNYLPFHISKKIRIDYLMLEKGGIKTLNKALELFEPKEVWVKMKPEKWAEWKPALDPGLTYRNFWKAKFQTI